MRVVTGRELESLTAQLDPTLELDMLADFFIDSGPVYLTTGAIHSLRQKLLSATHRLRLDRGDGARDLETY